jgi:hypothetical protein
MEEKREQEVPFGVFNPKDVSHFLESSRLITDTRWVIEKLSEIHRHEKEAAIGRAELEKKLKIGSQRLTAIAKELDKSHKEDLKNFHFLEKNERTVPKKRATKKRKSVEADPTQVEVPLDLVELDEPVNYE